MNPWTKLKTLVGYRVEQERVIIRPVRDARARPAKHLEKSETQRIALEGFFKKREV